MSHSETRQMEWVRQAELMSLAGEKITSINGVYQSLAPLN